MLLALQGLVFGLAPAMYAGEGFPEERTLSFGRDVRPILSDKCFACHGPDAADRQADLRLDVPGAGDGYIGAHWVLEPGDPEGSDLVGRIRSEQASTLMPPPESKLVLTDDEKSVLEQWIREGAVFEQHWSFEPVAAVEPPAVLDGGWPRGPIDRFVLARLEREGLAPSPEASRRTLIRRLTLDLTGLPPEPEAVRAFVESEDPAAFDALVDRLLASPHFGERMALPWLDAARYADTNGFSIDDHRDMWLWREWVIDAYNRNVPYDEFVTLQLAGDLVTDVTDETRLATGFLRNSMNTHEGGTIPEEYRTIYIADKIDTVSTVFMGLTMRCAQCHDHKYDPLSTREYYQMYAFFDSAHEPGMGAVNGNTEPVIRAVGPITGREAYRADVVERIATLRRYLVHPPELVLARADWAETAAESAEGPLRDALLVRADRRTDAQWGVINAAFGAREPLLGRHVAAIEREIAVLESDLEAGGASAMVMEEAGPRQTFVLTRGQYDQPDESQPVSAGVPAVLPPLDAEQPGRLELARWLVSADHPLTARVAVNRIWQMLMGRGIVATLNDFGNQGSYPTHPELLDHLASRFVAQGWDVKRLVREIVTSAAYRQSSDVTPALLERDPANELLGRMVRRRLPAEFVRDGALHAAGLLETRVGGPSVYPVQPDGLWREVSHFGYPKAFTAQSFYPSRGADLRRRSLYTFWKRTSPPPSLAAFDAPTREVCAVDRAVTNTPLQALVLLNDPEYVGAARALAESLLEHEGDSDAARVRTLFERATSRPPEPVEASVLLRHLEAARARYAAEPDAARLATGRASVELASWASLATVVLNLDEAITRP